MLCQYSKSSRTFIQIFVGSFLLYIRLLLSHLPPSRVSSPELPPVCSTAKGQSARSYCSQVPRWAWRRRNDLQDCKRKRRIPTNLLHEQLQQSFPSGLLSSLFTCWLPLTSAWRGASETAASGPRQMPASLLSAKHTATVGPGSTRPLWHPGLGEPPGNPNFCLCSKSVLLTSTYCGKSLSCSLLFFLMMLHVSLMTLQGTRKLHFSFKITTLSARGGDQKAKKKKSRCHCHRLLLGCGLREDACTFKPCWQRKPGAEGEAHTHTHVCKTYDEIGQCGIYAFKPNLQFNYNSLWMQS